MLLERWAPPGGWILAALVLLTLSTAAGVVFPLSPAGIVLQAGVGGLGAPLVPLWCAWAAWLLVRRRRPRLLRALALVVLSATWLLALALRDSHAGGVAGDTLLNLLDAGFGRSAGLALVSIAAAASLVELIGLERILLALETVWRLAVSGWRSRPRSLPLRQRRARRAFTGTVTSPDDVEPVILGPATSPPAAEERRKRSHVWLAPAGSIDSRQGH